MLALNPSTAIARLVERSLGDDLPFDQRLAPRQRRLGVLQARLVLGDAGLGLRDLRFDQPVVEAKEHVARVDEIALLEEDLDDLAVDARS